MTELIPTSTSNQYLADRHSVRLGEGSELGHVEVYLWALTREEQRIEGLKKRSADRERALRDRIAALIAKDRTCQKLLREEKADRKRIR